MVTGADRVEEKVSLLPKVSLRNNLRGEIVNFLDDALLNIDVLVMSLLYHVVDHRDVLPDVFIVVMVVMVRQESLNLQLLFQLDVHDLGLMQQLGIDVVPLTVLQLTVDVLKGV